MYEQVQSKQALIECLGWRLEGAGNASQNGGLVLRYGQLFCMRLAMPSQQQGSCAEGILELSPTGGSSLARVH